VPDGTKGEAIWCFWTPVDPDGEDVSAALTALVASGLPSDSWRFVGFLPRKKGELRKGFASPAAGTLIAFESPRRVPASLEVLADVDPSREVAVARELTKRHEEVRVGAASSVAGDLVEERGEFVVVAWSLGSAEEHEATAVDVAAVITAAHAQGLSERSIVELLRAGGIARREAYRLVSGR